MSILFALGSAMFLVPALAALDSSADWIGVTFFCGSICFTAASAVQLLAASKLPHRKRPGVKLRARRNPRSWLSPRVDWFSAAVQFPGTVLFNIDTLNAMRTALDAEHVNRKVWAPDMIGSACFLLSSLLAFANAEHRWVSWRPGDLDWWIAGVNLGGSIAFGVSALASYVSPESGRAVAGDLANLATAVGALGFLVGAVLLPLQATEHARRSAQG
jgi:hypothetical protein